MRSLFHHVVGNDDCHDGAERCTDPTFVLHNQAQARTVARHIIGHLVVSVRLCSHMGGIQHCCCDRSMALERLGWISLEMASSSAVLGGFILVAAGLYQFTALKAACLRYCE